MIVVTLCDCTPRLEEPLNSQQVSTRHACLKRTREEWCPPQLMQIIGCRLQQGPPNIYNNKSLCDRIFGLAHHTMHRTPSAATLFIFQNPESPSSSGSVSVRGGRKLGGWYIL